MTTRQTTSKTFPAADLLLRDIPFLKGRTWEIAPLENAISLNNQSYRVQCDGEAFLLRLASPDAHWLGIRRDEEIAAARSAAEFGIAPPLLYANRDGHLLMPFVQGRHWTTDEAQLPSNIARIGRTLRRLHDIRHEPINSSIYRRIERLVESARTLSSDLPANLPQLMQKLSRREQEVLGNAEFPRGVNHNDLWLNNFLDDGENLWLVDWEFAGSGNGVYDLTTIALSGKYDEVQKSAFLDAYGAPADSLAAMDASRFEVYFFEAVWALVQRHLRGAEPTDYTSHSRKMFDLLSSIS